MKQARFIPWLIVATAVFVAIVTMVVVVAFRRQADTSRDELQALLRVSSHVSTMSAVEWQAIAEEHVTPEMRETADAAAADSLRDLLDVAAGDESGGQESALLQAYRGYASAIGQELRFIDAGRAEAAHAVDAESVDPLYSDLKARIDEQVQEHEDQTAHASLSSDIGVVLIIALGIGVVGSLLWSQEAMRRRAQLAVAAREKAEALQESEQKFRAMVENLNEVVYAHDTAGVITYISPAVNHVAGYEPGQIVGRSFEEFVHPDDVPMLAGALNDLEAGHSGALEHRIVTAKGETRWVRSSARAIVEDGVAVGIQGVLTDITDLKSTQEALRQMNYTLRAIVEASPLAIIALDPDSRVTMWNQAAQQLFGWTSDEVIGKPYPLVPEGEMAEHRVLVKKIMAGGQFTGIETERTRKDGTPIDVAISAAPLRDAAGKTVGALGVIADITAKRRAEETIRHLAYHDPLTELPNRALFTDRLEVALAQARRSQTSLAVLYLDLDNFKIINDSVGHTAGDLLLKVVGDRLHGLVRETDTVARVGGDEFTILLAPPVDDKEAADVARRIVTELRWPWQYEDQEFSVSGSIGVAIHPADGSDPVTLLKNADQAMYAAKSEGRDTFRMYRQSMQDTSEFKLSMERGLRYALKEDQFVVHYQPQIDLRTGRIAGFEALVRWNHPERGLLAPGEFLPLAEETGVIVDIDTRVLETAVRQLIAWQQAGNPRMTMAVNLSALHFHSQGFLRKIRRLLAETGIDPSCLGIEITETMAMHQTSRTLRVLGALKRMGLTVIIDDFGTGHSSLTYLRQFPVDAIKIDRSFVGGIGRNSADETLVTAIVALGHSLDLDVIAEGVETREQFDFLKNLRTGQTPERPRGCDYFQGYLSSRPLPAKAIQELLDAESTPVAAG